MHGKHFSRDEKMKRHEDAFHKKFGDGQKLSYGNVETETSHGWQLEDWKPYVLNGSLKPHHKLDQLGSNSSIYSISVTLKSFKCYPSRGRAIDWIPMAWDHTMPQFSVEDPLQKGVMASHVTVNEIIESSIYSSSCALRLLKTLESNFWSGYSQLFLQQIPSKNNYSDLFYKMALSLSKVSQEGRFNKFTNHLEGIASVVQLWSSWMNPLNL